MLAKRHRSKSTAAIVAENKGAIPPHWLRSTKKLTVEKPIPGTHCQTMAAVIKALGGEPKVAKLTKVKSQHIYNWKNYTQRFPAKTYPVMIAALRAKGCTASSKLWGITEP